MLDMCLITSLLLSARERRIIRYSPCNAGPRRFVMYLASCVYDLDSEYEKIFIPTKTGLSKRLCHMTSLLLSAMEWRIIRDSPCKIFGSYYFCFVQFSLYPMPKRKRGVAGDAACRQEAIMKRERRVAAIDEERNRRFSTMAKSGQERRNRRTK
ncbi:hypothetical protein AVEN_248837-1 [Araneus ventricosus]|uniref:Uncharacterized protein n=1 Tax=Araneus ventricosus TaxID=182803 RepID=A0A4Y2HXB3_ARAVE|nr:hypothetical protein AVEN_248837-1 [Araneus ventricosus]